MVRRGGCTHLYGAAAPSLDLLSDPSWFLLVHEEVRACRHFLDDEGIDTMNLPPSSPHLDPTEHLLHMFLYLRASSLSSVMVQTWEQMIRTPSGIWNMSGLAHTAHGSHINCYHFELGDILASLPGCL